MKTISPIRLATAALLALSLGACDVDRGPRSLGVPTLVKKTASDEAGNAAAASGLLILRDGCLAIEHSDRSRTLLLWPAEARVVRQDDGSLHVLGTEGKAQRTVRVGEEIRVGGSELGAGSADSALVGPNGPMLATAAYPPGCTGPVWNVYSFEPASGGEEAGQALQGKWVVAELIGARPAPGTQVIDVTVTGDRIRGQSQCVVFSWSYTLTPSFRATREQGEAVCERTRTPWEKAFEEAVSRATSLAAEDGAVLISGPGGQALLRRP